MVMLIMIMTGAWIVLDVNKWDGLQSSLWETFHFTASSWCGARILW